jgi:aspartyl-tRNA synthetase
VKGFSAPGMADIPRRQSDELITLARSFGAGGLVTIGLDAAADSLDALTLDQVRTPARALSLGEIKEIATRTGAGPGDLILIAAGPQPQVEPVLGQMRMHMGQRLGLADPNVLAFCVITDFPLFEWDEQNDRWHAMHHPFTSPRDDQMDLLYAGGDLGAIVAKAYDIAANGMELAGGSIRIHQRELQEQMFKVMGHTEEQVTKQFGHLLEAFEYGAPPHGGFAGGIDRLVVTLSSTAESIRDAIAFPKTQAGIDPLFGAPSPVSDAQLRDLNIAVVLPPK